MMSQLYDKRGESLPQTIRKIKLRKIELKRTILLRVLFYTLLLFFSTFKSELWPPLLLTLPQ